LTDYDVIDATPYNKDILKEITNECHKQGLKMCFYHSIMDWHHPDYLPRRGWEKRSSEGAEFGRYVKYMKAQVAELINDYGPLGVLWFDGEWENTWDADLGDDLYLHVRSLQPDIIINNRVSKGRAGMAGTYNPNEFAGDFGTPEQEIPATGLDYDWETCMTMNNHWGYNKHDDNWKTNEDLIRKLIDIASKGGNFLLNVGPKDDGTFPNASIKRLDTIGKWMKVNGESIYGTKASLFENLYWGRSTTKPGKIYLHVFDWPENGNLDIPGLMTQVKSAYLLADPDTMLEVSYVNGSAFVSVPKEPVNPFATVIVLEFDREIEIVKSPEIIADDDKFFGSCMVELKSNIKNVKIRYTLDGSDITYHSPLYMGPIKVKQSMTVKCQVFRGGKPISGVTERAFTRVEPHHAEQVQGTKPGIKFNYYEGRWNNLEDFGLLDPVSSGTVDTFNINNSKRKEFFAFRFEGYISVDKNGMYKFFISSDDGSRLWVGDELVVDNDGLHGIVEKSGSVGLEKGLHPVRVDYFQKEGGADMAVLYSGPGFSKQKVDKSVLYNTSKNDLKEP
jgi:alpha-L-fucosidase